MALQTRPGRPRPRRPASSADHGLEGEGHVGARVAVGHRVDVEPVDVGLVQPERVPVAPHDGAQVVGAEGRRGGHGGDANLCAVREGLPGPSTAASPQEGSPHGICVRICGKKPSFGMNVSHSHRRTKRRWNPNVQRVRALVDGAPKRLHVCTSCIRAGKVTKPPRRTYEPSHDLTPARPHGQSPCRVPADPAQSPGAERRRRAARPCRSRAAARLPEPAGRRICPWSAAGRRQVTPPNPRGAATRGARAARPCSSRTDGSRR